ncbi:MAG: hypothetical protein WDO73_18285 [Ignavibacteriota bacterium]
MIAVIWTDWYAYHVARLRALTRHSGLQGQVLGIELVGGCGEHAGLRFRTEERHGLPINTLLPNADWGTAGQRRLVVELWRKLRAGRSRNGAGPRLLHASRRLCGGVGQDASAP